MKRQGGKTALPIHQSTHKNKPFEKNKKDGAIKA
jgi:hypothetical protein